MQKAVCYSASKFSFIIRKHHNIFSSKTMSIPSTIPPTVPLRYATLARNNDPNSNLSAMRGDYNEKSAVQQKMVNVSKTFIERGVDAHSAVVDGSNIAIADFGSSAGANSSLAMSFVIEGLRKKYGLDATSAITVVHNDLPSNNWNTLFDYVNSQPDSYLKKHQGVFAMASGMSFYQQVMSPNSLHFGFSNYALHWLSKLPTKITNHCTYLFGTAEEQEIFRKAAAQDWKDFLTARSAELAKGGVLVLHCLTVRQAKPISSDTLYQSAKKLCNRGFITDEELANYNYRIYFRTLAELNDQALMDSLSLEVISAEMLPPSCNPTYEAFKKHNDVDLFALEFSRYMSGAMDPTFHEALLPTREKSWLTEMLWLEYRTVLKTMPDQFGAATNHMFLVLRKK